MVIICTNCGTKLEDDYNYCINCGTKVNKTRISEEKEIISEEIVEDEIVHGDYCDLNCRHCYEEIIDSDGGITADYSEDMCGVDYYCDLGHSIVYGSFCEDYE